MIRPYMPPVANTGSRKIDMATSGITRGDLARRTGVNAETIRYFERIGILASPQRTGGGHRVYDQNHVRALSFIRRAKGLGFSSAEVRAIVNLGGPGKATCGEVREIASNHLEHVRTKIADLVEIERLLAMTIERCSGRPDSECAVIDMIEQPEVDQLP
jgi:MerR family mercuric resistance operon transcriptional regulator